MVSASEPPSADPSDGSRLHRDPADVEGLSGDKARRHRPDPATDRRAREAGKPYATEAETYRNPAVVPPDDPGQRTEAHVKPRR